MHASMEPAELLLLDRRRICYGQLLHGCFLDSLSLQLAVSGWALDNIATEFEAKP